MRAMAPELTARYQRATDLLEDVLAAGAAPAKTRRTPSTPVAVEAGSRGHRDDAQGIQTRVRARETPGPRFCWQCRKPLHARTDKCPFCGEAQ
jgi:hypothetical protein